MEPWREDEDVVASERAALAAHPRPNAGKPRGGGANAHAPTSQRKKVCVA